jgi:hypothetical protein
MPRKSPEAIEIRSYQVGFGDCFLLSFVYAGDEKRHVLVDFGTTRLPTRGSPRRAAKASEHMPAVAESIKEATDGKLTVLVATHRHADHISGFGTDGRTGGSGLVIRSLRPRVVVQPWTEDPAAARDATRSTRDSLRSRRSFVAGLAAMNDIAAATVELVEARPSWLSASLARQLSFLGEDNISNRSAVENLIAMGKARGARAVYARHGTNLRLSGLLPGVRVRVLGPPDLKQSEKIKKQRARDPDQFWHLLAGAPARLDRARAAGPFRRRAGERAPKLPPEARWFKERLLRLRGQQVLEIVRSLDQQLNNTSLILLFEAFGKRLLFPGDAQIENWTYALQDSPRARETRELLTGVDLYKVGHHGSLNATPKQLLWEHFEKRGAPRDGRMTSMLSTLPGKHGKVANRTEVPRRPLLEALRDETELLSTDDLRFTTRDPELYNLVRIEPD